MGRTKDRRGCALRGETHAPVFFLFHGPLMRCITVVCNYTPFNLFFIHAHAFPVVNHPCFCLVRETNDTQIAPYASAKISRRISCTLSHLADRDRRPPWGRRARLGWGWELATIITTKGTISKAVIVVTRVCFISHFCAPHSVGFGT